MSTSTPSNMTMEEVAENLAKIGSEKLTAAVLNAERSDHLLTLERSQLLKFGNILEGLLKLGELLKLIETPDLNLFRRIAWCMYSISNGVSSIADEQERIQMQRTQGESELRRKFPRMADRIYTHGDGMKPPHQLKLWSLISHIPHARLIDVDDQYDASTQVPAIYPALLHPLELNDKAVLQPFMRWQVNLNNRLDRMKVLNMSSPIEYHMYLKRTRQQSPPPGQVEGSERSGILSPSSGTSVEGSKGSTKGKQHEDHGDDESHERRSR